MWIINDGKTQHMDVTAHFQRVGFPYKVVSATLNRFYVHVGWTLEHAKEVVMRDIPPEARSRCIINTPILVAKWVFEDGTRDFFAIEDGTQLCIEIETSDDDGQAEDAVNNFFHTRVEDYGHGGGEVHSGHLEARPNNKEVLVNLSPSFEAMALFLGSSEPMI